ncbi:MAG: glycine cleavage system protein H [Pseudomonadota bacterium]|jgi:glycine cleavage system H protein
MDCNDCEFRPELHYDDQFQIWVKAEAAGTLLIGMTDLSQTLAGKILHVRVRRPGSLRPAGKPVATVETGKWAGPVPNVFDCEIVTGNEEVMDNPSLINADPYEHWIARVRSTVAVAQALAGLPTGEAARTAYCERAKRDNIRCRRA